MWQYFSARVKGNVINDGENPLVLLARIKVKQGVINEYLAIAAEADKAVEHTEEGMLSHNFDSEPYDPHQFVLFEVYGKIEDF